MQVDSIFRIASQTKALVSVGIMILQEEGRLLITDPVGRYIPEFNETTVAEPREDGGMVGQGAYVGGPRKSFSGGAGLLSTAEDYASFLQMMINGGALNGRRVLSRKSVELMTVDHLNGIEYQPGYGFGLGFRVVKDLGARGLLGSVEEFSWGGAYHSTYWVDPREQLVVVYFTQLIPAGDVDDYGKLRALIYQALGSAN